MGKASKNAFSFVGELVSLLGLGLFIYTIYQIVKDYYAIHSVIGDISLAQSESFPEVFSRFEELVIVSITKIMPISLVLIASGCLITRRLLTKSSRILMLSFSGSIVILTAYLTGGNFELVCAAGTSTKFLNYDVGALGQCFTTLFPIALLIFISLLLIKVKPAKVTYEIEYEE